MYPISITGSPRIRLDEQAVGGLSGRGIHEQEFIVLEARTRDPAAGHHDEVRARREAGSVAAANHEATPSDRSGRAVTAIAAPTGMRRAARMRPPGPPSPALPRPTLAPVVPGRGDDRGLGKELHGRLGQLRVRSTDPQLVAVLTVNPSSASGVATTAFPAANASMTLTRMPPPVNSGAITTAARSRKGPTSATSGLTSSPRLPEPCQRAGRFAPTMRSTTSGHSGRTLAGCRRSVVPPTRRSAGGRNCPRRAVARPRPRRQRARRAETPSGMISIGVVPASGLQRRRVPLGERDDGCTST